MTASTRNGRSTGFRAASLARAAAPAAIALVVIAGTACRFGGPSDELTMSSAVVPNPAPDAGNGGSTGPGATSGGTGGTTTPPVETPDAGATDATTSGDSSGDPPDTGTPDPGTCSPPATALVCDPVCNTGCSAATRCDIADTPLTGRCIGMWISKEGEACIKTAATNPCSPQLACDNGTCVRMCYHDSDCASATAKCCKTSIEVGGAPSGFKACAACN